MTEVNPLMQSAFEFLTAEGFRPEYDDDGDLFYQLSGHPCNLVMLDSDGVWFRQAYYIYFTFDLDKFEKKNLDSMVKIAANDISLDSLVKVGAFAIDEEKSDEATAFIKYVVCFEFPVWGSQESLRKHLEIGNRLLPIANSKVSIRFDEVYEELTEENYDEDDGGD